MNQPFLGIPIDEKQTKTQLEGGPSAVPPELTHLLSSGMQKESMHSTLPRCSMVLEYVSTPQSGPFMSIFHGASGFGELAEMSQKNVWQMQYCPPTVKTKENARSDERCVWPSELDFRCPMPHSWHKARE